MVQQSKPRVIKNYEKLDKAIKEQIKIVYPYGFSEYLITFTNKDGKLVSALPFETDEKYYLVKMTEYEAEQIIDEDDDFDSSGQLKDEVKEDYEDKYADLDYLSEQLRDDEENEKN